MRNVLMIALLVPMMALAVATRPVTALPENGVIPPAHQPGDVRQAPKASLPLVGTIDTVGGTTYDWWANGSLWRHIVNTPGFGLHITYMYSQEMASTTFPDRNMRYNFYDYSTSTWNWIDPDYMQSGVNTFVERSGYGNISADLTTGCAYVGRHSSQTGTIHAEVARDIAPGAGIFEYADGGGITDGYQWPPISVDGSGNVHQFPIMATYELAYTKVTAANWPTYEPLVTTGWEPATTFPTHNIAASLVSQKVACTWTDNVDPVSVGGLRISEDGGTTWGTATILTPPRVYGGDTVASWHITSLFPWYDAADQLHIVANVMPVVNDTGYIIPAVMCHYLNGTWTTIARAGCDPLNLQAAVGYNAMYACRPTICQDEVGTLYVAWEQFDSANVEPLTSVLRADVFGAASTDNGATWLPAKKLTDAGTHSNRFPSITSFVSDNNSVDIIYINDQTAGFWVQNEHPGEINPVFVQHIDKTYFTGVAEGPANVPTRTELSVTPNPVANRALVSYAVPKAGDVSLVVFDAAGRPVQTLASGNRAAGRYTATLDASRMANGVYFYTLTSGSNSVSNKLTVTH
jgi:hypothetical protein